MKITELKIYEVNGKKFDTIEEAEMYIKTQELLQKLYKEQGVKNEEILLAKIKEDINFSL
jgi:hypothetical protein